MLSSCIQTTFTTICSSEKALVALTFGTFSQALHATFRNLRLVELALSFVIVSSKRPRHVLQSAIHSPVVPLNPSHYIPRSPPIENAPEITAAHALVSSRQAFDRNAFRLEQYVLPLQPVLSSVSIKDVETVYQQLPLRPGICDYSTWQMPSTRRAALKRLSAQDQRHRIRVCR